MTPATCIHLVHRHQKLQIHVHVVCITLSTELLHPKPCLSASIRVSCLRRCSISISFSCPVCSTMNSFLRSPDNSTCKFSFVLFSEVSCCFNISLSDFRSSIMTCSSRQTDTQRVHEGRGVYYRNVIHTRMYMYMYVHTTYSVARSRENQNLLTRDEEKKVSC